MNKDGFQFEVLHTDKHCGARLSKLTTPRGTIDLPTFMPVGTLRDRQRIDHRTGKIDESPDHSWQHLPPRSPPRFRTSSRIRRPAKIYGLGWADADRQRRIPALQPRSIDQNHGTRRGRSNRTLTAQKMELTPERSVPNSTGTGS